MNPSSSIRIHGIHYTLPERQVGLEQLAAEGRLVSTPETMRDFGCGDCRVSSVPATRLASVTLKALLERHGVDPLEVGLLINASVLPTSSLVPRGEALAEYPTGDNAHLAMFRFSSTRLQDELGLTNARTVGLSELGCVSLSHAVWLAHAVMEMEDLKYALCVNADVFPEGIKREVVYNVCSDSACAVLLSRNPEGLRLKRSMRLSEDSCSATWLPSFHDMGLVDGLMEGFYSGYPVYLMSPGDFLKHPLRWLQAVSTFRVTHSGGPNFGYELCVRKATPEAVAGLDLSSWRSAYCGAEPVRAGTMRRFIETFSPRGFSPAALFPVYGLAEVTLKAPGPGGRGVVTLSVDKEALEEDRVVPLPLGDANAAEIVSCGESEEDFPLAIVEPESREPLPEGRVGEVWVCGPSVAQGYWGKPELSEETFRARLSGEDSRQWLRTGDLGFVRDGLLYITGRRKDLIIIGGRNHYPQDIEWTLEAALPLVRPGCSAAFSVEVDGEERLVVVAEVDTRQQPGGPAFDAQAATARVRQAINDAYQLRLHDLVFLKAGSIPKTSSGKIQRQASRKAYLERDLQVRTEDVA